MAWPRNSLPRLVGMLHVCGIKRGGEHDNGQVLQFRLLPKPHQKLETRHAGHLQVQQDKLRNGTLLPVGVVQISRALKGYWLWMSKTPELPGQRTDKFQQI